MTGTAIEIKVDDSGLKKVLGRFRARVGHMEPAMKIIGQIMRTSIVENFPRLDWTHALQLLKVLFHFFAHDDVAICIPSG